MTSKSTPGMKAARAATSQIEELLQPALDRLQSVLNVTERTGVFADVDTVLAAMADMRTAIGQAQPLAQNVDWPLSQAARRAIIKSLSAGIAQRERRTYPSGDQGDRTPTPLHPSTEGAP